MQLPLQPPLRNFHLIFRKNLPRPPHSPRSRMASKSKLGGPAKHPWSGGSGGGGQIFRGDGLQTALKTNAFFTFFEGRCQLLFFFLSSCPLNYVQQCRPSSSFSRGGGGQSRLAPPGAPGRGEVSCVYLTRAGPGARLLASSSSSSSSSCA